MQWPPPRITFVFYADAPAGAPRNEAMKDLWPKEAFTRGFEHWVVSAVQILLMVMIVLGLLDLVYLLFRGAREDLLNIQTESELQRAMQQGFAGILLVLIGLELLETVRAYLKSHRI